MRPPDILGRIIKPSETRDIRTFAICTLVTDWSEYREMQRGFISGGFREDAGDEYYQVDNCEANQADAFEGSRVFLTCSQADYVIICHQDVRLLRDGRAELAARLTELERIDPSWALVGNAGPRADGTLALRISDPRGEDRKIGGPFPTEVVCLDENFLVLRRASSLSVSFDLSGFHMYGADLCALASVAGLKSYVIDFHLKHLSPGKKDASYFAAKTRFMRKYEYALRHRWLPLATLQMVPLGGSKNGNLVRRGLRQVRGRLRESFRRGSGSITDPRAR